MKKAILITVAIVSMAVAIGYLDHADRVEDRANIELIEANRNKGFDRDDIERLYHWRNEGNCSKEFIALYDEVIKPL